MKGLATSRWRDWTTTAARELFNEALGLYARIQEPYSIGWAHKRLADVARDEDERARHIAAAREAWLSIGREDLVQRWFDRPVGQGIGLARGRELRGVAADAQRSRLRSPCCASAGTIGRPDHWERSGVGAVSAAHLPVDLMAASIGAGSRDRDNRSKRCSECFSAGPRGSLPGCFIIVAAPSGPIAALTGW